VLKSGSCQVLASVINDYSDKASEICKDITYKEKMSQINLVIPKERLRYLGSWKELVKRDKNNLIGFFIEVWYLILDDISFTHFSDNEIIGNFIDVNDKETYKFRLNLNNAKDKTILAVYNNKGFNANEQFIVKPKNEIIYSIMDSLQLKR
jgi:hypothetical protein